MSTHIFGIRHHGPGCARSLISSLEKLEPDVILIEGPPDADALLPFTDSEGLAPPVAILIYPESEPQRSVFYPFAEFSPEWQAIRFGRTRGVPVRFCDLPQTYRMAMEAEERAKLIELRADDVVEHASGESNSGEEADAESSGDEGVVLPAGAEEALQTYQAMREDPLAALASAAGYDDPELWWEHVIEQRIDSTEQFEAILEAMRAAREHWEDRFGSIDDSAANGGIPRRKFEAQREAWMRQTIRAAEKEGFQRIAVVCGAWHAPALEKLPPAKQDQELLKGMPKLKVAATIVPWTYERLSFRSGYGAGVYSPEWYDCLWRSPDQAPLRWLTRAGRLLRKKDLPASSASVIEAVRMSEALAAMRGLPLPGIREVSDSALSVLCFGNPEPLEYVRKELEVGRRFGKVPNDVPTLPLARDIEDQQKRLRMKPTSEIKELDLDLRNETDRGRSRLLHRLRLIGVPWGEPTSTGKKSGTFHEVWRLQWQVEFIITLIERSSIGSTLIDVANKFVTQQADQAPHLSALTELIESTLLAELAEGTKYVLRALADRAAAGNDVREMGLALPPLAQSIRYQDVRGTKAEEIQPVYQGLFERALIGLSVACRQLDEDAARQMLTSIDAVEQSVSLLQHEENRKAWEESLAYLIEDEIVHAMVRGRACRILLEHGVLTEERLFVRARLELSPAVKPLDGSLWLEGVLSGSALAIIHLEKFWGALDDWIDSLSDETFQELVPLVRRSFSSFEQPERRAISEVVRRIITRRSGVEATPGKGRKKTTEVTLEVDWKRAGKVAPILEEILGVEVASLFSAWSGEQREIAGSQADTALANKSETEEISPYQISGDEHYKRWRLILGAPAEQECGSLRGEWTEMDQALEGIYGGGAQEKGRRGGLGASAPKVHRWLGDIRKYFPKSVVQVMQKDALDRLGLQQMLMEPELLETLEADIHLVATLANLGRVMPERTKETARQVVQKVVNEVMQRLRDKTVQAVRGSLNRASRTTRPKANEINWDQTIRKNLGTYIPERGTIVAERLIGHRRKTNALREIHLCVDQSGSMAPSVVYSSIFAAVLATIKSVKTRMVVFDTAIVDLTDLLSDPIDVIFGTQLGGGTDINRAVAYCSQYITKPSETIFVMITDLCEGGNGPEMLSRVHQLIASGVQVICLLALSDDGAPYYDNHNAAAFAAMGVPTFACTPDKFPELIVAAIHKRDIGQWAHENQDTKS